MPVAEQRKRPCYPGVLEVAAEGMEAATADTAAEVAAEVASVGTPSGTSGEGGWFAGVVS